jgi:hypothetical protein
LWSQFHQLTLLLVQTTQTALIQTDFTTSGFTVVVSIPPTNSAPG